MLSILLITIKFGAASHLVYGLKRAYLEHLKYKNIKEDAWKGRSARIRRNRLFNKTISLSIVLHWIVFECYAKVYNNEHMIGSLVLNEVILEGILGITIVYVAVILSIYYMLKLWINGGKLLKAIEVLEA